MVTKTNRAELRIGASKAALLIALASGAAFAVPAAAQDAPAAAAKAVAATSAANPQADTPPAATGAPSNQQSGNQEEIVVTGARGIAGGLMKPQIAAEAMSSITPTAIAEKISVASPLQIANTLPGANFGSSDAYGLSIRNFLSIRGLDQTEIGFLVDGAPAISIANYYPYSESWADNENISDITITPGNSRLQDPIINASGGEFIESIRAPLDRFGGRISGSAGSFSSWRAFGGIDTGYLGSTGLKAYLSYSHAASNNYVGPGRNKKDHVDFRAQEDWSAGARSTLFVSYDNLQNARIPILNLTQSLDGINNHRLDTYAYSATYVPGVTAQYYPINIARTKNWLVSNNNDVDLSGGIKLHVTPYFRYKLTDGPSQSKLSPTSVFAGNTKVTPVIDPSYLQGGSIVTASNTHYQENITGVSSYIDARLSATNQLSFGYWYQHTLLRYHQYLEPVDQNGNFPGYGEDTALRTASGVLITGQYDEIRTNTNQLFVGDTQSLFDDKLALTLGVKQLFWSADIVNHVVGAEGETKVSWSRPMPRFLVSYKIDGQNQLYANVTTNARMPLPQATYVTTYNVASGANSAVANLAIKPEYTISSQVGYRYNGVFNLDVTAFYMKLKNHQVQGTQYVNGFLQTTAIAAGGETIRGASVEASTRSYGGFSLYGNAQYLDATFDDNLPLRGDYLPNKGKKMVLAPDWIVNAGLRFARGGFYTTLTYKYVSQQYSTFMNDQAIPSMSTFDLGMGYKFRELGPLKGTAIRLTVTNIGNKPYISTLSAAQPNAVATTGINGTALPAAAPTYYIAAQRAALLTISTDF